MVRGDIDSIVCDRRFWLPILAVRVHGSVDGAIFTGAAGANLWELTDVPDIRHNISSNDTAESVRDDRDG